MPVPALAFDYTRVDKFYKPHFNDDLWIDNTLPDAVLAKPYRAAQIMAAANALLIREEDHT